MTVGSGTARVLPERACGVHVRWDGVTVPTPALLSDDD